MEPFPLFETPMKTGERGATFRRGQGERRNAGQRSEEARDGMLVSSNSVEIPSLALIPCISV